MSDAPDLVTLVDQQRPFLLALVRREARGLLGFEEADDLVQGISARALGASDAFEWQGDEAFKGWLVTLARRHVADRNDYWHALKRGSGQVVRLTWAGSDPNAAPMPAASGPGPATFAARRELIVLAARAMAALSERDRDLVRLSSEGLSPSELAQRLQLSPDTARKAATRAIERLRKTTRLLMERSAG